MDIRVLQVEYVHSNKTNILRIMKAAGYENPFDLKEDLIFVKRGQELTEWLSCFLKAAGSCFL